jgi:two-component system response regulator (stage 0 sporulation protein F)
MAHILVIDDGKGILSIIVELLTLSGHRVDVAENGKIGLKLAGINRYDLIITDVVMPELDGFDVLMALKESATDVGIIVMSGGSAKLNGDHLLRMAGHMGAVRVLRKPLDFTLLLNTVTEILTPPPDRSPV